MASWRVCSRFGYGVARPACANPAVAVGRQVGRCATPSWRSASTSASARPWRVLFLDDREGVWAASAPVKALTSRPNVDVRIIGEDGAKIGDLDDTELADVAAVVAFRERTRPMGAAFFDRLPSLEMLFQSGGHANHIDVAAATERGIAVALGRGVQGPRFAVPELTFALAIGALRHIKQAVEHMAPAEGGWPPLLGRTLGGKRLGLLGAGRLGSHVARIGAAFGMDVVAWDRKKDGYHGSERLDPGAKSAAERTGRGPQLPRIPLRELLATSDVVSVHLALTDESRGLLGRDELAAMKPGAVLVNTARGAILDEEALIEALGDPDAPLAAAGLDVFTHEPLAATSPLRSLPNVLLTPHIGFTVEEVLAEFAAIACRQINEYMDGGLGAAELANPEVLEVPHLRAVALR